jgi:hypothetical protein
VQLFVLVLVLVPDLNQSNSPRRANPVSVELLVIE